MVKLANLVWSAFLLARFAAGAMIYVISHEIIAETHRHGSQAPATFGVILGMATMMLPDISFASPPTQRVWPPSGVA